MNNLSERESQVHFRSTYKIENIIHTFGEIMPGKSRVGSISKSTSTPEV